MTKEEYIDEITTLLHSCNDVPLLDVILRLLGKSV